MIGGPEIAQLVNEFKNYDKESEDEDETLKEELPHHEDSNSFEKRFLKDVKSLKSTCVRGGKSNRRKLYFIATNDKEHHGRCINQHAAKTIGHTTY